MMFSLSRTLSTLSPHAQQDSIQNMTSPIAPVLIGLHAPDVATSGLPWTLPVLALAAEREDVKPVTAEPEVVLPSTTTTPPVLAALKVWPPDVIAWPLLRVTTKPSVVTTILGCPASASVALRPAWEVWTVVVTPSTTTTRPVLAALKT